MSNPFAPPGKDESPRSPFRLVLPALALFVCQGVAVYLLSQANVPWVPLGGPAMGAILWGVGYAQWDPHAEPSPILAWVALLGLVGVLMALPTFGALLAVIGYLLWLLTTVGGVAAGTALGS